jgi:hypothetical protein
MILIDYWWLTVIPLRVYTPFLSLEHGLCQTNVDILGIFGIEGAINIPFIYI